MGCQNFQIFVGCWAMVKLKHVHCSVSSFEAHDHMNHSSCPKHLIWMVKEKTLFVWKHSVLAVLVRQFTFSSSWSWAPLWNLFPVPGPWWKHSSRWQCAELISFCQWAVYSREKRYCIYADADVVTSSIWLVMISHEICIHHCCQHQWININICSELQVYKFSLLISQGISLSYYW